MRSGDIGHRTGPPAWAARIAIGLVISVAALGCMSEIRVTTAVAPNTEFSSYRTFHFLHMNDKRSSPADANDPMLENSIMGQQVRDAIARELTARGYTRERGTADLSVAYYVGSRNKLMVTDYDYGYPFWGRWGGGWRWGGPWGVWHGQEVTQYEQGTVIVDVLDVTGKQLLWRGVAKTDLPSDPSHYGDALTAGVRAIMLRFPGHAAASR